LELPLALFLGWTALSVVFSAAPQISLAKLPSVLVFLVFYLAQATVKREWAVPLVCVLLLTGVVGSLWSVVDIGRGRGVVIEAMAEDSPYRATLLQTGDAVWRVGGRRVSSIAEIDEEIRRAATGQKLSLSAIAKGEHAEWAGIVVTPELQKRLSPSGLDGAQPTRRFRASGWTRHFQTFADILQMLANIALGFALAFLARRRTDLAFRLVLGALVILLVGVALTAMRTALVAFGAGALVMAWRATNERRVRLLVLGLLGAFLVLGALVVTRTRATGALRLGDDSSALRWQIARAALARLPERPLFGHGLDALKQHWREWGFPGDIILHTHSTPLQIAFERGLPGLFLWFWLVFAAWRATAAAEHAARDDTAATHGLLLGITGALTGFLASSFFNYNWGDAEVVILLWWLLGIVAVSKGSRPEQENYC
jgi:O-antigen ligase